MNKGKESVLGPEVANQAFQEDSGATCSNLPNLKKNEEKQTKPERKHKTEP